MTHTAIGVWSLADLAATRPAAWSALARVEGGHYLQHAGSTVAHISALQGDGGALVERIVGVLNRSLGDG